MKFLTTATVCTLMYATAAFAQPPDTAHFRLLPIKAQIPCLSLDGSTPPDAKVLVKRGGLNDTLFIEVTGLKPGLQFDLFTVERTNLLPDGSPQPRFPGFGLAWYQSDLEANQDGHAKAVIKTILLDQIFGFDTDQKEDGTPLVPPTNTFHVGFWFNNPEDAVHCGFDASKPTPFNGEHKAGPLAMISVPDAITGIGPLCASPDETNIGSGKCNP